MYHPALANETNSLYNREDEERILTEKMLTERLVLRDGVGEILTGCKGAYVVMLPG